MAISLSGDCAFPIRTKLALDSCRTACRLAEQVSDPRLPTFRKRLASVEAKLASEGRDGA